MLVASHNPAEYATVWTRDLAPSARAAAIEAWTAALITEGARVIHTGIVALARPPAIPGRRSFVAIDRVGSATGWRDIETVFRLA